MAKINVDEALTAYGGEDKLIVDMAVDYGADVAKGTISVWRHRKVIPDWILTGMVLANPEFDPRDHGWQPSR